ncbi:hypothetical protein MP228_002344 [Amoeboaphelidium protococcarum]|nr:hypothetical protein MP228_002344 [Amoeboaphelidium protococcarum]
MSDSERIEVSPEEANQSRNVQFETADMTVINAQDQTVINAQIVSDQTLINTQIMADQTVINAQIMSDQTLINTQMINTQLLNTQIISTQTSNQDNYPESKNGKSQISEVNSHEPIVKTKNIRQTESSNVSSTGASVVRHDPHLGTDQYRHSFLNRIYMDDGLQKGSSSPGSGSTPATGGNRAGKSLAFLPAKVVFSEDITNIWADAEKVSQLLDLRRAVFRDSLLEQEYQKHSQIRVCKRNCLLAILAFLFYTVAVANPIIRYDEILWLIYGLLSFALLSIAFSGYLVIRYSLVQWYELHHKASTVVSTLFLLLQMTAVYYLTEYKYINRVYGQISGTLAFHQVEYYAIIFALCAGSFASLVQSLSMAIIPILGQIIMVATVIGNPLDNLRASLPLFLGCLKMAAFSSLIKYRILVSSRVLFYAQKVSNIRSNTQVLQKKPWWKRWYFHTPSVFNSNYDRSAAKAVWTNIFVAISFDLLLSLLSLQLGSIEMGNIIKCSVLAALLVVMIIYRSITKCQYATQAYLVSIACIVIDNVMFLLELYLLILGGNSVDYTVLQFKVGTCMTTILVNMVSVALSGMRSPFALLGALSSMVLQLAFLITPTFLPQFRKPALNTAFTLVNTQTILSSYAFQNVISVAALIVSMFMLRFLIKMHLKMYVMDDSVPLENKKDL